jgi:hypothetical protein
LRAQALSTNSNSIPFPQHDLPTHKRLFPSSTLGCAGEYLWAACALASTSFNTTSAFTTLHLELDGYFSLFLEYYKLDQTSSFFLVPSSWRSNACHIYKQVVLLGWFLNTFGIVFTLNILQNNSLNYSNFVFILRLATFHPKLHMSLEWPIS